MSSSVLDSADVSMNKAAKNLSSGVEILVGEVSAMEKKEGVVGESWVGGGLAVGRAVRVRGELAAKIKPEQRSQLHGWGRVAPAVTAALAKALRWEMLGVCSKR